MNNNMNFTKRGDINQEEVSHLHQCKNLKIQLQGHTGCITALAQSHNKIFSGSDDKSIKSWDSQTYIQEKTKIKCNNWVNSLLVHNDLLFAAGADKVITIYDINSFQEIQKLVGHKDYINILLISNNKLFSASSDATIIIWDISTYHPIATIKNTQVGELHAMTMDMEGRLYCAGTNKLIQVYDSNTYFKSNNSDDVIETTCTLSGHTHWIKALHTTENYLFSASYDKTIRVWSLHTLEEITVLYGHTGYIQTLCTATVNDEMLLFSGSFDKTVKIWNINLIKKLQEKTDNSMTNTTATITNTSGSDMILKSTYTGYTDFIHTLMVSQDNELLIAGSGDSLYIRSIT